MLKKRLLMAIVLLLLPSSVLAQDEDKPNVVLLSFQPWGTAEWIEIGFVKSLTSYGLIPPEVFQQRQVTPTGFSTDIYRSLDAGGQLDLVANVVAEALESEPDALVTLGGRMTLAALLETHDLDDPPAVIFVEVYNPYDAGIADAPCIKPDHLTGIESGLDYAELLPLLIMQNPDVKTIGTIHGADDAGGAYGAAQIAEAGESLGLTVEQAAVTSLADIGLATEGLVSKGVEALMLPVDAITLAGLPLIGAIASDNGIPIFGASIDHLFFGALAGGGFADFLDVGDRAGVLVAAYLAGELDLATTGIGARLGAAVVGINEAVAAATGIAISEELRERADFALNPFGDAGDVIADVAPRMQEQLMRAAMPPVALDEREESDREFLSSLECTAERIAEQQAELDAKDG